MKKIYGILFCAFIALMLLVSACKNGSVPVSTPQPSEIPTAAAPKQTNTVTETSAQPSAAPLPSADPAAEQAAKKYYDGTVFEVVSMKIKSITQNETVFGVRVKRGGVIQEPDRSITLQMTDGVWQVVNEGY